jgi:sialate O-acetylesterase
MLARPFLFLVVISLATGHLQADITLPRVFGDNMVLQRDKPVPVWGKASPGEKVTVGFAEQEKSTTAGDDGSWQVTLDPLSANKTPQSFVVSGKNKLTLDNVLVGEVWLCSGQSNMEWPVAQSANPEEEKAAANFPEIRHFKVPRTSSAFAQCDVKGDWKTCSPSTVSTFTAVGYYFARELFQQLDVPIGLVNSSWGGTSIEVWMLPESVAAAPTLAELNAKVFSQSSLSPEGRKRHEEYLKNLKEWTAATEEALARDNPIKEPPAVPWPAWENPQPTQLYKGMIHPLAPFAMRGALWYQGESNGFKGEIYKTKLEALINGWRTKWNQGEFPFYIVQISNFSKESAEGKTWSGVREAQQQALSIPNTGLAVTIDIGDSKDIHPKNKQDVGKRLALWALAGPYGKPIEASGPLYKSYSAEGSKIRISFDHAKDGLMIGKKAGLAPVEPNPTDKLKWIEIAGEDRLFKHAQAVIEDGELVVSSPEVPSPVAVRYAYKQDPVGANLYNTGGLPASPFRTDSW